MGLRGGRKWVWVVLFFSLALNIGFIYTAADRKIRRPGFLPPPPDQGILTEILDKMDLPQGAGEDVINSFEQLRANHLKFARQLFKKEKEILDLMGRPGKVDMEMVAPLIESYSRLSKESALVKAGYMLEIRALLGPEKSFFLISELKKDFKKRFPKGKFPD